MKQSEISDRIIVQGAEDNTFTRNFEITLSPTGQTARGGTTLTPRLIHSQKKRPTTDRRATRTAERNRIIAAIVTYLEELEKLQQEH
jgi:hypothetical protein